MINYSIVKRSVNANLIEINQAKSRINQAKKEGKTPQPADLALVKTEKQNAFAVAQYTGVMNIDKGVAQRRLGRADHRAPHQLDLGVGRRFLSLQQNEVAVSKLPDITTCSSTFLTPSFTISKSERALSSSCGITASIHCCAFCCEI